MTDVQSSRVSN